MPDPSRDPESRPPVTVDMTTGMASGAANPAGRAADPLRTLRLALIAVAALLAVLIAASWIDARKRSQETRLEIARRFQQTEQAAAQTTQAAGEARDAINDLQSRVGLLEGRLAEAQSQQAALEELYRELAPGRDDWTIAEVEQVLLLASQQLQLAGNVRGALTALQLADGKLQRLDRPQFLPLRKALARDMDRLKALPFVDVSGLSLRIDQAAAAVDKLPLAIAERAPQPPPADSAEDASALARLLRQVWADISSMVRVENTERSEVPLLLPAQEYYLRENLKLRLLSSRLALLSRDEQTFRADLKSAEEWLRRYFDVRTKSTQAVLVLLRQLQSTELPADMPDLNASLEAVRVLKAARERSMR